MISTINNKIDIFLKFLLFSFPILIILGSFSLNFFSVVFSLYALFNYKILKKFKIFNKNILIIFFSFIILIFPFESIDFKNSFVKYLSFFRFVLMLLGLIIFFEKNNKENSLLLQIYKIYIGILTIIIIDVLIEYYFGSNIMGFSSNYRGRIASFTNDELIIGYIYCFLTLFTFIFMYKKTNNYYFFIIACILIIISFFIGERSNFLKLFLLIIFFSFIHLSYFKKLKIKILLIITTIVFILLLSFVQLVKNTPQAKKFVNFDEIQLEMLEKDKFSLFKGMFYNSKHAPHYLTAYNIFLNYPIFGIGIDNFYKESRKKKYENKELACRQCRSSTHPHQIYLEIMSEVGLTGLIYFIYIFFYPIFICLKSLIKNKEYYIISHLFLHVYFIFPILPSGSFFGTNYGIPFWFNLAILLYLSKKNLKLN